MSAPATHAGRGSRVGTEDGGLFPPPGAARLKERFANTAAVLARCRQLVEDQDGCSMSFPRSSAWARRLRRFGEDWRESCPQMRFEVDADGDRTALWLRVSGPQGTREWLGSARTILLSGINPPRDGWYRLRRAARRLTCALRVLPDFLIIGASKCGTTSLYAHLCAHPDVRAPMQKEMGYFDVAHGRGLRWYRSFFPLRGLGPAGRGLQTGEATPDYLFHPEAARRVQAELPRARCIALLRDPVDRAYSFYHFNRRAGLEDASFEQALEFEERRLDPGHPAREFNRQVYSYKARGRYAEQIEAWRRHLPADRLLILGSEELASEPRAISQRVLAFLGLPPHAWEGLPRLNIGPYPAMAPATRRRLAGEFAPYNRALYALLGRDLGWSS